MVTFTDEARHNLDVALEDVYVSFKEVEIGHGEEGSDMGRRG